MNSETIATFCAAGSDDGLLVEIDQRLQELRRTYSDVEVVSISHSATAVGNGSIFWNALITCNLTSLEDNK